MEALKVFRSRPGLSVVDGQKCERDYLCFRHALTNQYWLIRFDQKGMIDSACHVDYSTEKDLIRFTKEYNDMLEVEANQLELASSGCRF